MPAPSPASRVAPADQSLVAQIDHLVVAAATLEQGAAWCEATFGVGPAVGGKHALFGTHNRLLLVESEPFPSAYLEIIAIDPDAPAPSRPRWFGLDDAALQTRLAASGPCLLHVVARTTSLAAHLLALAGAGVDAGETLAASRPTAQGLMQWRIAVRRDGALLYRGALPTLIEWASAHPASSLPASPVRLGEVALAGVPDPAAAALGLRGVRCTASPMAAALRATFETQRHGRVTLESA